jgi:DNA-binding LacI/PurR family transcriptional regulator
MADQSRMNGGKIANCQIDFPAVLAEKSAQFDHLKPMQPIHRPSLSEHAAQHLREGFAGGRWSGKLPGVSLLSKELGVSRDAVRAALRLLEVEGFICHGGAGKSRLITKPTDLARRRVLRIGILLSSSLAKDNAHSNELIFTLRQAIEGAGHICFIATKSAEHFHRNVARIRRYMKECEADAWILYSARRDVLEMASELSVPIFALGNPFGLPMAGSSADLTQPICECVDLLVAQGHRSIVLIGPWKWRQPKPNQSAQVFLDRLRHHGIQADARYNLPEWEHTPEGLNARLQALFLTTPPTALMVMEPECLGPVLVFLAGRGLRVPEHVSVVNILPDPMQAFYQPAIAHFRWLIQPHVKWIIQWVNALARGEVDLRVKTTKPVFVPAESIGPCQGFGLRSRSKPSA